MNMGQGRDGASASGERENNSLQMRSDPPPQYCSTLLAIRSGSARWISPSSRAAWSSSMNGCAAPVSAAAVSRTASLRCRMPASGDRQSGVVCRSPCPAGAGRRYGVAQRDLRRRCWRPDPVWYAHATSRGNGRPCVDACRSHRRSCFAIENFSEASLTSCEFLRRARPTVGYRNVTCWCFHFPSSMTANP